MPAARRKKTEPVVVVPEPEPESEEEPEEEPEEEEEDGNESPVDSADEYEDAEEDDEEGSEDDDEEDEEEEEVMDLVATNEDVVDDLLYDLCNFTACSYHPVMVNGGESKEDVITAAATRAAQLLYKKLHELPTEPSDTGAVTILPTKEVFMLPRTKKIPEAQPETRWEKFARERGIKNTKKDRMVFDEATGEYRPRWGYKRANAGIEELPIVEVKHGDDPNADPWAKARTDKKDRVKKNLKNQMRNMMHAEKGKKGKGYDPEAVPGIPMEFSDGKKRGKGGVRKALQLVQHSTASMGRFDEMRPGEPVRKITGKKRSFRDNLLPVSNERSVMKSQLRIVEDKVQKKAKGVTNSLAAYEGILPDAPSLSFKKTKGRGKNAGKK